MRFRSLCLPSILFSFSLSCFTSCAPSVAPHRTGSAVKLQADAPGDPKHSLISQMTFDEGVMLPWLSSFGNGALGNAQVQNGALCVHVEKKGEERWDAQVRHREFTMQEGHTYTLSFKAWSSRPTKMSVKVGMSGPPYTDYLARPLNLTSEPQSVQYEFEMSKPDDPTAEVAFHVGGRLISGDEPIDVCLDDIVLSDPSFTPPPPAAKAEVPAVRVNQVGYLPSRRKLAVVLSDAKEPRAWRLLSADGSEVATGKTQVTGADADSGDFLHLIDFSSYQAPGEALVLEVGEGMRSDPFDIDAQLYSKLKYDAFKYFYHNRSGIEIKLPYAEEEQWSRPAGHPRDVVPCAKDVACDYELDVTGGWYDAGDHGKYVVNGGISVWTLMNAYERAKHLKSKQIPLGDGPDTIPESGNQVPDLLDEARWQMEFMLAMQVPTGQPLAGMVHHKMHNVEWTALGLPPHEDKTPRHLRAPSTAATLNLAATAAQAARIWKTIDPEFSKRALQASERAWTAAKANPNVLASKEDTVGGGPYDDSDVSDEFYWAAAELFATTGNPTYQAEMTSSSHHPSGAAVNRPDGGEALTPMTWQRVDMLGTISLAVVPHKLGTQKYRQAITSLAQIYTEMTQAQGYRFPLAAGDDGYPWGSNSFVLNNMLLSGLAYDFSKQSEFLDTVVFGMDYLLGRNALGQSYVTGYGERPLKNPHHRFWAKQASPKFPPPPPGAVSGGPNSALQDPYAKAAGLPGCKPQKCFADHIESWSTNEITINWNAPFTWVAAWLDEYSK